jgi:hypothetical protein
MPTSKVLVFTATEGYRHDSIEDAIALLKSRQSDLGIEFHYTEYVLHLSKLTSGMEMSLQNPPSTNMMRSCSSRLWEKVYILNSLLSKLIYSPE